MEREPSVLWVQFKEALADGKRTVPEKFSKVETSIQLILDRYAAAVLSRERMARCVCGGWRGGGRLRVFRRRPCFHRSMQHGAIPVGRCSTVRSSPHPTLLPSIPSPCLLRCDTLGGYPRKKKRWTTILGELRSAYIDGTAASYTLLRLVPRH